MSEYEKLLTKESVFKNRLDKLIENGKKTATLKRTQGFFESKITELKRLWNEYNEIDLDINQALTQVSAAALKTYLDEDRYGQAEFKYAEYLAELTEGLRKFAVPTQQPAFDNPVNQTTTIIQQESALPKITIPKYDGNYDMWKSFHDLFVSLIHTNGKLSPVQKLHHLKSCLIGDAEKLLRHVPITNDDYEPAWDKLKARYENKRIIVNHQLKGLVNQPKITMEKPKALKALIDTSDECLQQLKSLGVDTSSWDVLLVHLLVQKLPYVTLRLWEEEQGVSQDLPKYQQFNDFLNKRLKILESIADTVNTNASSNKPGTKDFTLTHHATTNNKCPVCNGKHFVQRCEKYRHMNINARVIAIKKSGRCLNCLSSQHTVKECDSKYKCFKCDQRHHTTLHDNTNPSVVLTSVKSKEKRNSDTSSTKSEKVKNSQAKKTQNKESSCDSNDELDQTKVFISRDRHLALLSTALVIAQSEHGEPTTIRCLIDSGSQTSFITEEACKLIGAMRTPTSTAVTGLNTSPAAIASQKTKLKLRSCGHDTTTLDEEFLIIKTITDTLPTRKIIKEDCKHLRGLTLADPTFWKPGKIDALLGVEL